MAGSGRFKIERVSEGSIVFIINNLESAMPLATLILTIITFISQEKARKYNEKKRRYDEEIERNKKHKEQVTFNIEIEYHDSLERISENINIQRILRDAPYMFKDGFSEVNLRELFRKLEEYNCNYKKISSDLYTIRKIAKILNDCETQIYTTVYDINKYK